VEMEIVMEFVRVPVSRIAKLAFPVMTKK